MNTNCSKRILCLIKKIYDTVEHPSCWQEVLKELSAYVSDGKAALTIRDNNEKHIFVDRYKENKIYGFSNEGMNAYMTKSYLDDVWVAVELASEVGEIRQFSNHIPINKLQETKFYKEWLLSEKIMDGISVQLFKNKDIRIVLNVFYGNKPLQINALLRDIEILMPFLLQATKFWMTDVGVILKGGLNSHSKKIINESKITKREWEFLITRIRTGSNSDTAKIMGITMNTVYTYTKRIHEKLNVGTFSQAALLLDGYTHKF